MHARDEQTLRRFVACREAGDLDGARRWWGLLLEENFDRVRALVAAHAWDTLSADERDDAVALACAKLWKNMLTTFRGTSMGEWVNATRQCVAFACVDVQRAAARRRRLEAPLDGDGSGAADRRAAVEEQQRTDERAEARAFVSWALPRMRDERQRVVVERTLDGVPAAEIAGELGVGMDNLYQLRSRGLRDLATLKERYEG